MFDNLIMRLHELKQKGTRLFELWRKLQYAQNRTKQAEIEAACLRVTLKSVESDLVQAREALAVKQRDPLAEAQSLLAMADDLLSRPPVTQGEVMVWRGEYRAYRLYHRRRNR